MSAIIADTSALALASANGLLDLLPEQFTRIILSPTVVDELVEHEIIDDLMESAVERMMEVVSLTQPDEALALQLAEEIASFSVVPDANAHRGEAEALALMQRGDLAPQLFLCDDTAAQQVAQSRGLAVQSFEALVATARGDKAAAQLRATRPIHEPQEAPAPPQSPTAPPIASPSAPSPSPALQVPSDLDEQSLVVEIDDETATLLTLLMERGVGGDPADVVRRAVRGLAAALDL